MRRRSRTGAVRLEPLEVRNLLSAGVAGEILPAQALAVQPLPAPTVSVQSFSTAPVFHGRFGGEFLFLHSALWLRSHADVEPAGSAGFPATAGTALNSLSSAGPVTGPALSASGVGSAPHAALDTLLSEFGRTGSFFPTVSFRTPQTIPSLPASGGGASPLQNSNSGTGPGTVAGTGTPSGAVTEDVSGSEISAATDLGDGSETDLGADTISVGGDTFELRDPATLSQWASGQSTFGQWTPGQWNLGQWGLGQWGAGQWGAAGSGQWSSGQGSSGPAGSTPLSSGQSGTGSWSSGAWGTGQWILSPWSQSGSASAPRSFTLDSTPVATIIAARMGDRSFSTSTDDGHDHSQSGSGTVDPVNNDELKREADHELHDNGLPLPRPDHEFLSPSIALSSPPPDGERMAMTHVVPPLFMVMSRGRTGAPNDLPAAQQESAVPAQKVVWVAPPHVAESEIDAIRIPAPVPSVSVMQEQRAGSVVKLIATEYAMESAASAPAGLINYLKVDWARLESRLQTFVENVEELGTTVLAQPTPQSTAFWVSIVVAVGVVAIERKSRQRPELAFLHFGQGTFSSRARTGTPRSVVETDWRW